jgi:ParB-like nuclease family protein
MSSDFEPKRDIQCEAGPLRIKDRSRELRRVPAKELVPNPRNWRRHSKAQADALRGLLAEVGYADALLVKELPNGRLMLIDGHLRAETTPDLMVPVLVLDVTAEEADTILLTLDPLAAMAASDGERLKKLLEEVRSGEPAVQELMRRTVGERIWAIVHPTELNEATISPERADELKKKWHTEPEQLWQVGPHRIACGDSTDPGMISRLWSGCQRRARLLVTDPPYGVYYSEKTKWMHRCGAHRCRKPIANDDLDADEIGNLFANALRISLDHTEIGAALYATVPGGPLLPVFIEAMNAGGFSFRTLLVWVKQAFVLRRGDYHSRHEPILY